MRGTQILLAVLGVAADPAVVRAAIQPSFHLDACAWSATHIVVVTEGEKIDGVVEVLESWKGDLKKGERITVPELAAFAPDAARAISKGSYGDDTKLPARVTCSRMALFLIRSQEKAADGSGKTTWLPAGGEW